MPRKSHHPKSESFNFRVSADLKAAFTAATEAEDKPAADVLRDFMRAYIRLRERRAFAADARRQSLIVARASANPTGDEAAIMRELDAGLDADDFASEWR